MGMPQNTDYHEDDSEFEGHPANGAPPGLARLMQPWLIALASAAGAGATALAALRISHTVSPGDGLGAFVRSEAGPTALAFLAVFGALGLLLTTAAVAFELVRVRLRLERAETEAEHRTTDWWRGVFSSTNLLRLSDRIVDLAPAELAGDELLLQSRFDSGQARREVLAHYRNWLVRAQVETAILLIAVIAGLGIAQDYAHASLAGFAVPARTAIAALVALAILAFGTRMAIGASAEPLIDAVAAVRLPRVEMRLAAILAAFVGSGSEERRTDAAVPVQRAALDVQLQQFAAALEEDRDAMREAITRLSANAAALSAAARSLADQPGGRGRQAADPTAITQLRQDIAKLTAAIERLPTAAPHAAAGATQQAATPPAAAAGPRRRRGARGDLGSELRRLIQEFE
jgi:hypothetical protein